MENRIRTRRSGAPNVVRGGAGLMERVSLLWVGLCAGVQVGYFGSLYLLVRDEQTLKAFSGYMLPVLFGGTFLASVPELIELCLRSWARRSSVRGGSVAPPSEDVMPKARPIPSACSRPPLPNE